MKRQRALCAIKELSLSTVPPEEQALAIKNFRAEAKMLSVLSHPCLPAFTHFFMEDQRYFLVMEYIDGATLEDLLERNRAPFSEKRVLSWAEPICDVLEYLHSQDPPIIFRDMKPGNVMLTRQGHIKLIDFSIARFFRPTDETDDTQLLGTPGYAPPEQYGTTQTDERSDIYALGMTLHHLLTNKFFEAGFGVKARQIRATSPNVSESVARALEKATALEPSDRYESVAAFRRALLSPGEFIFETGEAASDPETLAQLCARYPEEASEYLASGEIARWLHDIGEEALVETAEYIRTNQSDPQRAVEQFLHAVLGPNIPRPASSSHQEVPNRTPEPRILISPQTLDFDIPYPGAVLTPMSFVITSDKKIPIRGTIRASDPWIRLNRTRFNGTSTRIVVSIDTTNRNIQGTSFRREIYMSEIFVSPDVDKGSIWPTQVISVTVESPPYGSTPPKEKPPQPVLEREFTLTYGIFVDVRPKEVPIGGEVEVMLSLGLGLADNEDVYQFEVPHNQVSGLELNTLLTAPHFHINGKNASSLPLDFAIAQDRDANSIRSQTARFSLTALRAGPVKLQLDLYTGNVFKTSLEYTVQVARINQTDSFSTQNLTQPHPMRHPDLILQVRNDVDIDNVTGTFHYHLTSSRTITQIPEQGVEYRSAKFPVGWLERVYALLSHTLESTVGGQSADRRTRLASFGQYLFHSLLPLELQRTLRSLVDIGHTLLILSDQDAIFPWTLLHDGNAFLGEHFIIGRWLRELHDALPHDFPIGAVSIAYYEGITQPEKWAETLMPPGAPPAMFLPGGLLHTVDKTEIISGLHLLRRGKSSRPSDLSDAPALLTQTQQETNIEQQVQVAKFSLCTNHPLVTLSYLHADISEVTTLEQSWSSTFIRAGCSAFVGPLWAVQPTVEATFVSTFYARLWAGEALGDAFKTARELTRMAVPNSIDYLAYVLFGDPMARPYRPVKGDGYATVEPVGREMEDPVLPGTSIRFRVSLRRRPPIWHEGRVIEVAQALNFKHLKISVITFGLQVTPATPITLMRAPTGDYFGWFSLKVPIDSERTTSVVQVHFVDRPNPVKAGIIELDVPKPIHSLRFTLPILGGEGNARKSEPIGMYKMNAPLEIVIDEKQYNLGHLQYTRTAYDAELENFTQEILDIFRALEKAVNSRKDITLPKELCRQQLIELARWGMVAYRSFFEDKKARNLLSKSIAKWDVAPTFVSALTPFPWEVLYEGKDHNEGNPKMFWGLRYTPARILNPEMSIYDYPHEQTQPLDMLFCLHHKLVGSHQQECPAIKQLVLKSLG